jgi:asparagine synthase (glutamine-hydrolysing)
VPPRTCVAGVSALGPGHAARFLDGRLDTWRWWDLDLGVPPEDVDARAASARVGELLEDAVRLRLRADVSVGAYLSGGLDSSILCALAQEQLGGTLSTYSVAFSDPRFDESAHQRAVAHALATRHRALVADRALVAERLPEVVRHAEQVLVRAAPAPLLDLAGEVRAAGGKVVLTGEGSDEIFLGYDLYREARVRGFWARRPASRVRPALLRRLYPYLPLGAQGDGVLRQIFGVGLDRPCAPAFSHQVRWAASGRIARLFSAALAERTAGEDPAATLLATLPPRVLGWPLLARAQYLEMQSLLAGNLLGPQGDRMLMARSVEGRFPYLDHRVVEAAARVPEWLKLRGLEGKWVLRRYAAARLPAAAARPKFPYRAPAADRLTGPDAPEWARALLAPDAIRLAGLFDPDKVARLTAKLAAAGGPPSEADAMAITAVATAQLLPHVLARPPARADVDAVALEVA